MEDLKIIGYYLCGTTNAPEWLRGVGERVLSVSGCIGELHPRPACFMGGWRRGEDREYQRALMLDDRRYRELSEEAARLFSLRRIDVDSRFLCPADARTFRHRFCRAIDCRVVSVSTTPEYFRVLAGELEGSHSGVPLGGEADRGPWLGSDILGWDICGFHSFLCNSLQQELPEASFRDPGLLANDFPSVVRFARRIAGLGEPVVWLPCRIGDVS